MANWFEIIVPDDRTWSQDYIHPVKELKKGGAMDIARYLSTALERTDEIPDTDHFTAVVNIRNGFIPSNDDYSGFSIQIEGVIMGEEVDKIVAGDSNPTTTTYVWYVRKITFFVDGRNGNDHTKETVIDAGDDYIMRVETDGKAVNEPGNGAGARYGAWWANHAEFNPKITKNSRISIKTALRKNPGRETL